MNHSPSLRFVFVALLVGGLAGCSSSTPPSPPVLYTVTGVVSETTDAGTTPVAGAQVTETRLGRTAVTDANGIYSLSGLPTASNTFSVKKEGYVTSTVSQTSGTLDVRLERIRPYILSGVVFETTAEGRIPVEGVEVYCDSCGSPVGHTFVYTDAAGFYMLEWSLDGVHPLYVTKAGFQLLDPSGKLIDGFGRIHATVRGDTRFDIELGRR